VFLKEDFIQSEKAVEIHNRDTSDINIKSKNEVLCFANNSSDIMERPLPR